MERNPNGLQQNVKCSEVNFITILKYPLLEHRDKDSDGKLNKEEMREWIMPLNFDHAEAEAKHLVGIADDDKDGKLSPEEVIAHYDTFVGSQATDYGEQLHKHDPADL